MYYGGETEDAIRAILTQALPMLYGLALHRCQVLITDGGLAMVTCVGEALRSGYYPNAVARRCFWHAVTKAWGVEYSSARAAQGGGIGYAALSWVSVFPFHFVFLVYYFVSWLAVY